MVTFAFAVTAVLIVPFVRIYTADITDANYIIPVFACLIAFAHAMYCICLPYNIMVLAAGHYKETQMSAIIEAVINIVVSVALAFNFGLIGVAIGMAAAMIYRTVYLAVYLKIFAVVNIFSSFCSLKQINYVAWFVLAVKVALTAIVILLLISLLFYEKN